MIDFRMASEIGTRAIGRTLLVTKKYSPQILTTIGIVGGITASVIGARATLKLEPVVDDIHIDAETMKDHYVELAKFDLPTGEDQGKQLAKIYALGAIKIGKLYAPAISLGVVSIGCIISAQGIMQNRNVALMAAYSTIEKGFSEYRKRVEASLGNDEEKNLYYGVTDTTEVKDPETGVVTKVSTIGAPLRSDYARWFDEYSTQWSKIPEYNLVFLKCHQQFANDQLRSRGHVFLNEVYDALGLKRSEAGALVGWIWQSDGDNFIDFGIYDPSDSDSRVFVNGLEDSILLDFNVDGVIYDKIGKL